MSEQASGNVLSRAISWATYDAPIQVSDGDGNSYPHRFFYPDLWKKIQEFDSYTAKDKNWVDKYVRRGEEPNGTPLFKLDHLLLHLWEFSNTLDGTKMSLWEKKMIPIEISRKTRNRQDKDLDYGRLLARFNRLSDYGFQSNEIKNVVIWNYLHTWTLFLWMYVGIDTITKHEFPKKPLIQKINLLKLNCDEKEEFFLNKIYELRKKIPTGLENPKEPILIYIKRWLQSTLYQRHGPFVLTILDGNHFKTVISVLKSDFSKSKLRFFHVWFDLFLKSAVSAKTNDPNTTKSIDFHTFFQSWESQLNPATTSDPVPWKTIRRKIQLFVEWKASLPISNEFPTGWIPPIEIGTIIENSLKMYFGNMHDNIQLNADVFHLAFQTIQCSFLFSVGKEEEMPASLQDSPEQYLKKVDLDQKLVQIQLYHYVFYRLFSLDYESYEEGLNSLIHDRPVDEVDGNLEVRDDEHRTIKIAQSNKGRIQIRRTNRGPVVSSEAASNRKVPRRSRPKEPASNEMVFTPHAKKGSTRPPARVIPHTTLLQQCIHGVSITPNRIVTANGRVSQLMSVEAEDETLNQWLENVQIYVETWVEQIGYRFTNQNRSSGKTPVVVCYESLRTRLESMEEVDYDSTETLLSTIDARYRSFQELQPLLAKLVNYFNRAQTFIQEYIKEIIDPRNESDESDESEEKNRRQERLTLKSQPRMVLPHVLHRFARVLPEETLEDRQSRESKEIEQDQQYRDWQEDQDREIALVESYVGEEDDFRNQMEHAQDDILRAAAETSEELFLELDIPPSICSINGDDPESDHSDVSEEDETSYNSDISSPRVFPSTPSPKVAPTLSTNHTFVRETISETPNQRPLPNKLAFTSTPSSAPVTPHSIFLLSPPIPSYQTPVNTQLPVPLGPQSPASRRPPSKRRLKLGASLSPSNLLKQFDECREDVRVEFRQTLKIQFNLNRRMGWILIQPLSDPTIDSTLADKGSFSSELWRWMNHTYPHWHPLVLKDIVFRSRQLDALFPDLRLFDGRYAEPLASYSDEALYIELGHYCRLFTCVEHVNVKDGDTYRPNPDRKNFTLRGVSESYLRSSVPLLSSLQLMHTASRLGHSVQSRRDRLEDEEVDLHYLVRSKQAEHTRLGPYQNRDEYIHSRAVPVITRWVRMRLFQLGQEGLCRLGIGLDREDETGAFTLTPMDTVWHSWEDRVENLHLERLRLNDASSNHSAPVSPPPKEKWAGPLVQLWVVLREFLLPTLFGPSSVALADSIWTHHPHALSAKTASETKEPFDTPRGQSMYWAQLLRSMHQFSWSVFTSVQKEESELDDPIDEFVEQIGRAISRSM